MCAEKLHADEVDVDTALGQRVGGAGGLVAGQFPRWADLPVTPFDSDGTVNVIFRLGGQLSVRLPRVPDAVADLEYEHRCLTRLAPHLPLPVPEPARSATDLAGFVEALWRIDPIGGPVSARGRSVADRAADVRTAIAELGDTIDSAAAIAAWEAETCFPATC
jgi:aminoglycoside phosphotransferase (APT) family kinase protein